MKIICLIKFIPDVEDFKYDYERNVLIRENMKQILNPEDACAVAFALTVKRFYPSTVIEVLTMGPQSVSSKMEEILRLDVDHATLITDKAFIGSDTYATSRVLATYLKSSSVDLILSGTHTLDGDTSHVPAQIAEWLELPHVSNIISINMNSMDSGRLVLSVDHDQTIMTFAVPYPSVLSLSKDSAFKMPYVRYDDLNKEVSHRLKVIDCAQLGLRKEEVGFDGSKTQVVSTFVKTMTKKDKTEVKIDEAGLQSVIDLLKEKGVLA
ncbi:MAG: electron transfer flavoprotein subunit alpha/beta [Erysipelotrichaceae bacterium]|nr:MAG: electron transfer flavoprotein subunit [Erysipelotrichaceae bacterium]TXT19894.1 MAG: electron transfer flavoprotein subunit alpha/beta [Erysipelotrichaceae bacterium]